VTYVIDCCMGWMGGTRLAKTIAMDWRAGSRHAQNTEMFELTGRTALVTGASGGIGGAVAKALHSQGAEIMLSGTRGAALAALAGELGERTHIAIADLSEREAADRLVKQAEAAMGHLDILVNNAGLTRDGLVLRMKDEDWQAVIEVDLTAAFRLTRAALRGMVRRRHGRIIGVTSVVALTGNPGQANYAAAKAAMIGMSKSIAAEVAGRGVTVNCVAPGFVETAMTEKLSAEQRARLGAAIPAGRFGAPADVAAAIVYLASEEAAYVTGQTLHVNGGMAML
jgi:3-oxoacyl-[acyl-carrier protein] reductase